MNIIKYTDEYGAVHHLREEDYRAKALIDAAPDLLAACKSAVESFEIEVPMGNETIAELRAAIAKAEGRA